MFTSDHLSNYLFTATAQGFWQPEQTHLVRSTSSATGPTPSPSPRVAAPPSPMPPGRYAFPVHAVAPETLALGEACLRDGDPIPALRRKLVDQLDDLARALKVRTAYAWPGRGYAPIPRPPPVFRPRRGGGRSRGSPRPWAGRPPDPPAGSFGCGPVGAGRAVPRA